MAQRIYQGGKEKDDQSFYIYSFDLNHCSKVYFRYKDLFKIPQFSDELHYFQDEFQRHRGGIVGQEQLFDSQIVGNG